MNRFDEYVLAWDVLDHAKAAMSHEVRTHLILMIGIGDLKEALMDLLAFAADNAVTLPARLALRVRSWVRGYEGTDVEGSLRDLAARITTETPLTETLMSRST